MADPKPIQQQIKIDADTTGADDAQRAMDEIRGATRETSQETEKLSDQEKRRADLAGQGVQADRKRTEQSKQLKNALLQLLGAERNHQAAIRSGENATEQDTDASRKRRAEIKLLSRDLARLEDDQEQLNRELRESVDSHRQVGSGADMMSGAFRGATGAVSALTGGIVGTGGLGAALSVLSDEMRQNVTAAREFQEAFLNLQFLSDQFNPQEKEFVGKAAVFGGRQPAEVAQGLADVKSFFPGKSDQENQALLLEALELGRTTPAPLESITSPILGLVSSGQSPQEAQNTLRATIVQGGVSDPGVIGSLAGEVLAPGQAIGNLSPAESLGLVAGATGLDRRNPAPQITALRSILLNLQAADPERQKLIESAGIDTTNFLSSLETLGVAIEEGRLDPSTTARLVGAEGVATAASLGDPDKRGDFLEKVRKVVEASKSDRDLTAEVIAQQFKADPATAINFAIKQQEAADTVARANDINALESDLGSKLLDNELRDAGVGPIRRFIARNTTSTLSAVGLPPDLSVEIGGRVGLGNTGGVGPQEASVSVAAAKLRLAREGIIYDDGVPASAPGAVDAELPAALPAQDVPDEVRQVIRQEMERFKDLFGAGAGESIRVDGLTVVNKYGTEFIGAGDPLTDDLNGSDRE